jgi:hypothetical protein
LNTNKSFLLLILLLSVAGLAPIPNAARSVTARVNELVVVSWRSM